MRAEPSALRSSQLSFRRASGETLVLALAGDWHLKRGFTSGTAVERELVRPPIPRRITFDAAGLGEWDSSLVAFVTEVLELSHARDVAVDPGVFLVGSGGWSNWPRLSLKRRTRGPLRLAHRWSNA